MRISWNLPTKTFLNSCRHLAAENIIFCCNFIAYSCPFGSCSEHLSCKCSLQQINKIQKSVCIAAYSIEKSVINKVNDLYLPKMLNDGHVCASAKFRNIASRCHQLKWLSDTNYGSAVAAVWDSQARLLLRPQLRSLSDTQRLHLHVKGNAWNLSENKELYYLDTSRKNCFYLKREENVMTMPFYIMLISLTTFDQT